jgi:ubiquitin-activating enzyme E1
VFFEKDDDSNNHIDILTIISNIRGSTYNIEETNNLNCKLIAGKVVPALSTTTTLVTALSLMEMLKYLHNSCNNIHIDYKDTFINSAINLYLQSEPQKSSKIITGSYNQLMGCKIKAIPESFTSWDLIKLNRKKDGIQDINDLLQYMKDEYNIDINMLLCKNIILYNSFSSVNMNKRFHDIYSQIGKNKSEYLTIDISSFDSDNIPILIPKLVYCWDI